MLIAEELRSAFSLERSVTQRMMGACIAYIIDIPAQVLPVTVGSSGESACSPMLP